jgi:hypothetical protein
MIKTLITGQVKHQIAKMRPKDGDAQPPKVSLEMDQGVFFSIQNQKLKDALEAAGINEELFKVYETLSKNIVVGDSNVMDKSQKYWEFNKQTFRDYLNKEKRLDIWENQDEQFETRASQHPNLEGYKLISEELYGYIKNNKIL